MTTIFMVYTPVTTGTVVSLNSRASSLGWQCTLPGEAQLHEACSHWLPALTRYHGTQVTFY